MHRKLLIDSLEFAGAAARTEDIGRLTFKVTAGYCDPTRPFWKWLYLHIS